MKWVTLALIAVIVFLGGALAATIHASRQQAAREQSLAAQDNAIHAQVADIAARLHLIPAGSTQLILQNIGKQIGRRVISPADSGAIANTLIPGGVMNFQVDVMTNDPETIAFARQMFNTLLLAGWTPDAPGPVANYQNNVADVAVSAATKKQFPAVYKDLINAFAKAGIAVTQDTTGASYAPAGTVDILVGGKP
jgi:hypothetical protein